MGRLEDHKAQQGGQEDAQYLAHIGAQQELDGFADVVIDPPAFLHRAYNGGEIVVRQHHIRHVFGHVRAGDAHAYADIRAFDGGRVVDPVPGHGGYAAPLAPGVDDAHLMLRLHPGIDAVAIHGSLQGRVVHLVELGASNSRLAFPQDAQLVGYGNGGIPMIARDHNGTDPRLLT